MYVCMYVCMHVCMYACMYVCMYVRLSDQADTVAILAFHPDRLGHCCCLRPEHLTEIITKRIPVEVCVTSNMHTAQDGAKLRDGLEYHVFGDFCAANLPICVCTDDTGVFANSLTFEYMQLAHAFGLSRQQVFALAEGAIPLIFDESTLTRERLGALFAASKRSLRM
jgi:adenosine deaminase